MNAYLRNRQTILQKKMVARRWRLGASCRAVLFLGIAVFGFLYLIQTNALAAKGYEMSDLEQQKELLEQELRKLEVEVSTHRSMQSIQERLAGMDLVDAGKVEYLATVGTVVARR